MPFTYPGSRVVRRHAPSGYTDYSSFKPWLRDEFTFRCVFCLLRERMLGSIGQAGFAVEHLTPRAADPTLECEYANLLYACSQCNSFKGDLGPVLDPCRAAYARHLLVNDDGSIRGLTREGRTLIRVVRLDREELVSFRRRLIAMVAAAQADPQTPLSRQVLELLLSYPSDMPDLRTLRPPANGQPQSADDCHFALAERGELAATY